jgi:polyisoprenyl-phosphate glycosyltransferase
MSNARYSLVIPIYNEEETLQALLNALNNIITQFDGQTEVLFVNDGSKDLSLQILYKANQLYPHFKIINLSRNFGHQIAVTAGLDYAEGEAVVIMDADLQDPPEVILELIKKWQEGYEIVYAVRSKREGDSLFKKITANVFYRLLKKLSNVDTPLDVGDFRLVDKKVIKAFRQFKEHNRYVRGMFSWMGFKQIGVVYDRKARFAGETKYPLKKMIKFAWDGLLGFSDAPLKLALKLGFWLSFISALVGIYAILAKLMGKWYVADGWTSLMVVISLIGGIQLIVLGLMGLYISRIHDEVRNRPQYLVTNTIGCSEKNL